jgi:hypothetical protein
MQRLRNVKGLVHSQLHVPITKEGTKAVEMTDASARDEKFMVAVAVDDNDDNVETPTIEAQAKSGKIYSIHDDESIERNPKPKQCTYPFHTRWKLL